MIGWHHQLNGHEFEQTPGVGDVQTSLACCGSWGHKLDIIEGLNNNKYGFKLQGSTHTQIFFNKYVAQLYMILGWLNPGMWNTRYRGPIVKSYVDFFFWPYRVACGILVS